MRPFLLPVIIIFFVAAAYAAPPRGGEILNPAAYKPYFDRYASQERAFLGAAPPVPWSFFLSNLPWIDVPDKQLEEIYYFRWYAFQKHIKLLPDGSHVIDEFIDDVPWAGAFNAINDSAEHHMREARWLRDPSFADQDATFWLGKHGDHRYSLSTASAVYQIYLVTGNRQRAVSLLSSLKANNAAWNDHLDPNGLYWSIDDRDGMEKSISGNGYRPTLNSYMFADALSISRIAEIAGDSDDVNVYRSKAERLRDLIEGKLWNPRAQFYEVVQRTPEAKWAGIREQIGYIPWAYYDRTLDFPNSKHLIAWKQLNDPEGFEAAYGPTTAERRDARFMAPDKHECLWNGPSWPFATTQTLVGMANVLHGPPQATLRPSDYRKLLQTYVRAQHIQNKSGELIPWIDEDLNADTGEWIARDTLEARHQLPINRGRYYNHSGFADLIITGLIGVIPSSKNVLRIDPLVDRKKWPYFALQDLPYHGHSVTVIYDRTGKRYRIGSGLKVYCDGELLATRKKLAAVTVNLAVIKNK